MKKRIGILLVLSLTLVYCMAYGQKDTIKVITGTIYNRKKQSKVQLDTLSYLKQFEINKANYIGQPFSTLLNDMTQIQPKTVWSLPIRSNKKIIRNTLFNFCEMDYSFHNTITLSIHWQTDIPINQTDALGTQNQFYFTNDEKAFYSNKIVKDIKVYR